ncbi:hypothetical protein UlMin_005257 [Ulmus minor]
MNVAVFTHTDPLNISYPASLVVHMIVSKSDVGPLYAFLIPLIPLLIDGNFFQLALYALVCNLRNPSAIERLRNILCHSFRDIDTYTTGFPRWPRSRKYIPGRHCSPGPYSLILTASKELPKQCIMYGSKTAKYTSRKNVGIRMLDDEICQAIVEKIDAPFISTSVKSLKENDWMLDPVATGDSYGPEFGLGFALDFIFDLNCILLPWTKQFF